MKRCAICDYAEGIGSDMLGVSPDNRKVVWKETHQEFQCDECAESIKDTIFEQEIADLEKEITEETIDNEISNEDFEVCGVPTTLSESDLPF